MAARKRISAFAIAAALAFLLAFLMRGEDRGARTSTERAPSVMTAAPVPLAAADPPAPTTLATETGEHGASVSTPSTRTILPRPTPSEGVVPPRGTPRAHAPLHLADELPGPLNDRRGGVHPNAKSELEALNYGLETIDDDVRVCLEAWGDALPDRATTIHVGFRISAEGLTEAWVADAGDLPFGPRTCFANAVYGVDWSNIVRAPAEITRRFELTSSPDSLP